MVVWIFSVDITILHTFLSAPACTACTDMVNSKELERDVTTPAMAKNMMGSTFYVRSTNKGCYVHAMCKMLLF